VSTYEDYVAEPKSADPVVSHEHKEAGLFTEAAAAGLPMPEGYRQSITTWYAHLAASA
jgi:hypothetical protein